MHARTHRQNHDFQIAHFLVGRCHTPDGAYALLCDLKDEREAAIANYHVGEKRALAKVMRAKRSLESDDPAARLEAEADLDELATAAAAGKILFAAAVAELSFINSCIDLLLPLRKFKHLADPEAHEAAQFDEWKFELIARAENFLLCNGTIPPDELATMRVHPAFATAILPAINRCRALMKTEDGQATLLTNSATKLPRPGE